MLKYVIITIVCWEAIKWATPYLKRFIQRILPVKNPIKTYIRKEVIQYLKELQND